MKYRIEKFAYLKTPLYKWTTENEQGGSFSNSGMHKSEKICIRHFLANNRIEAGTFGIERYDIDAEGKSQFVRLIEVRQEFPGSFIH